MQRPCGTCCTERTLQNLCSLCISQNAILGSWLWHTRGHCAGSPAPFYSTDNPCAIYTSQISDQTRNDLKMCLCLQWEDGWGALLARCVPSGHGNKGCWLLKRGAGSHPGAAGGTPEAARLGQEASLQPGFTSHSKSLKAKLLLLLIGSQFFFFLCELNCFLLMLN